jgi:hypothetical protein
MAANGKKLIDSSTGSVQSSGSSTSLFNAFYVFKYSGGVGTIDESIYSSNNVKSQNGASPVVVSNPTASAIIEWAKKIPRKHKYNPYVVKDSPYTWSDFLFCKWYGIIPNNRLVTLRKYPLGVTDTAGTKRAGKPSNIPVAQAVTWFGAKSGNDINSLWQSSWELAWTKKDTTAKDVQGTNIVNVTQSLVSSLADSANPFVKKALANFAGGADLIAAKGDPNQRPDYIQLGTAAIEKKQIEFLKSLYSDTGAYWNQVQGPVNVKNQFLIRDRGLSSKAPDSNWKLIFEYKTDAYFGMNQRRVGLDILANMLELTYSSGEWLESLNIYYKNAGISLSSDEQKAIESCLVEGHLDPGKLAEEYYNIAKTRVDSILAEGIKTAKGAAKAATNLVGQTLGGILDGKFDFDAYKGMNATDKASLEGAIYRELTVALADSFPGFLQQRASVANTPTGNWHLTIGNPMNPIMRIGDLIVRSCELSFGEELGPDDFPIDMKFTVTLSPTKPRDSRDIRRSFNLGRTDYVESFTGNTFDQANTYGTVNKRLQTISAGNGGAGNLPADIPDTALNHAKTWLNTRYGTGMVNVDYLQQVYFYVAKEGVVGGKK